MIKKNKFIFLRFFIFSVLLICFFAITSIAYTTYQFHTGDCSDFNQTSVSIDTTELSNYLTPTQIENLKSTYGDIYMVVQSGHFTDNTYTVTYIIDDIFVGHIFRLIVTDSTITDYSTFVSNLTVWGFAVPSSDLYSRAFSYYSTLSASTPDGFYSEDQYLEYGRNQYSAGFVAGKSDGETIGYQNGYDIGKDEGYDEGYSAGEAAGYQNGYDEGYDFGLSSSYDAGYQEGFSLGYYSGEEDGILIGRADGLEMSDTFMDVLMSIFSAPSVFFGGIFDFDFLGINLYSFIAFILTLSLVGALIKFLI